MTRHTPVSSLVALALTAATLSLAAVPGRSPSGDWPQFLGPQRNGIAPQTVPLARAWAADGPRKLWSFPLHTGFGGAALYDNHVYVTDRLNSTQDVLYCLHAGTGSQEWSVAGAAPGVQKSYQGTRSTPAVDDARIYFTGPFGQLYCADKATRSIVWQKDTVASYDAKIPGWDGAQSPLLYDGMVIVAVGGKQHGVVAFDRATGTQVWASAACGALTHSSPGLVRIGGVDQVVLACAKGMVGINAADGTDLWRWNDWHPKMAIPSPTLVGDDCLFIVEGYGGGCGMCRITSSNGTFRAETVFTNTACNGQIPTAVYRDGYIYSSGNSNNKNDGLMCLDLRGNVKWKTGVKPKFERGNLLLADDLLFMLDGSSGMLRLIAPQPDRYVQLAEANVTSGAKGQIWGPLALADGRLYVRGHAELVCLDVSAPSDWPWWRGPYRNGISLETDWEPAALSNKSNVVWQSNVGNGHSAVAISGARLYTMGNRNNRDIVVCLDVATGTQLWRVSYSCPAGDYPGPRSTPVVDDMRVYTLSRDGQAYCLDALTGNVLWHTNLTTAFGAQAPTWGMASSAVVFGPYVLYNAGSHGIMLDKRTGVSIWSSPAGIGNYNTPVLHVGTKTMTAFFFNKSSLCCVDVATGKLLWSFPWETRYDIMAADPLPIGDAVFISSAYDKGAALVAAKNSKPKTVWQNKNMCNHFSTCVLIDGHLYGISGNTGNGALVCLDPTTGAKKWRQPGGFEALTAAGDKLICVTLKGEAVVVRATPTAYMEAARCAVLPLPRRDTKCWTMPVLNRGRIFFRNSVGDLLCVDVSK